MSMFIYLLQGATPGAQEPKNENIFNVFTTDLNISLYLLSGYIREVTKYYVAIL